MGALVYLLAAGRGTRAGGPKAWINFKGKSLLERQIEFLLTLFKPGSIAVSIQTDWLDRCKKINKEICWTCANPDALALDSLQRLLTCP
ncbi:MAG: nucleotidyltransferase family protein [Elusimicrobia bacterium]|nr:nucleotidyltransferase family protein [Elusimicrobiota bacterium]